MFLQLYSVCFQKSNLSNDEITWISFRCKSTKDNWTFFSLLFRAIIYLISIIITKIRIMKLTHFESYLFLTTDCDSHLTDVNPPKINVLCFTLHIQCIRMTITSWMNFPLIWIECHSKTHFCFRCISLIVWISKLELRNISSI